MFHVKHVPPTRGCTSLRAPCRSLTDVTSKTKKIKKPKSDVDVKGDVAKPTQTMTTRVVAIANQKGGVGKTTTTVNLGAALAERDLRVLVIDLDPQGNASTGLGLDTRAVDTSMYDVLLHDQPLEDCIEPTSVKGLFVAPSNLDLAGAEVELVPAFSREQRLKRTIEPVLDQFDFVLIDCPPSLGLLTVNAFAAASEVLVPIQCEYYALEGVSQLLSTIRLIQKNLNPGLNIIGILLTMFDRRVNLSMQVAREVRHYFKEKVFRTIIPRNIKLTEAPSFGKPIFLYDIRSPGAMSYLNLATEIIERTQKA